MLLDEGLDNVFARHDRFAEATCRAVRHWGFEIQCAEPRHYSSALTAVRLPEGHSANALRATILDKHNMSLGNGLGQLNDIVFRIGHLGDFGDLPLVGTLGGVEMGCARPACPTRPAACWRRWTTSPAMRDVIPASRMPCRDQGRRDPRRPSPPDAGSPLTRPAGLECRAWPRRPPGAGGLGYAPYRRR